MSFDDNFAHGTVEAQGVDAADATQENLCYKKLSAGNPLSVVGEGEQIHLPAIIQPITLNATINVNGASFTANAAGIVPKELPKEEKKSRRIKNLIAGFVMLLISATMFLPFIFSLDSISGSLADLFAAMPALDFSGPLNALQNVIVFATNISEIGNIWMSSIHAIVIALGLLFVVFNVIKALIGILVGVKGRKYIINALVTAAFFAIIIVLQIIGVDAIGLNKINFLSDIVFNWKYSQSFVLIMLAVLNIIAACICALFVPKIEKKPKRYAI